jgi:hypothetical protein
MMLGPDRILACPICGAFAKAITLMSGNTFGAVHFTDGSMIAMHMPDVPRITRCKNCNSLFWLNDENAVWEPWGGVPADPEILERAQGVEPPSADDFAEALTAGLAADPEQEIYLRVRLWWAANQRLRTAPKDILPEWSADMAENLERLDQLLDDSEPGGVLLKAEIARETGRFDEAAELLDREFPGDFAHAAAEIRRLAAERTAVVRMIPDPSRDERGARRFSPTGGDRPPEPARTPPEPVRDPARAPDAPRPISAETRPDTEYYPEGASTPSDSGGPEEALKGRSFANLQVRSDHPGEIEKALDGVIHGRAYISSGEGGWVQVCDEAAGPADVGELYRVARELSARLRTGVFAFLVKDANLLWYWLYEDGVLVDQFDSWPNAFGEVDSATRARIRGNPQVLSRYCLPGSPAEELEHVLKPTRLFEEDVSFLEQMPYGLGQEDRLRDLARLLGFSEARCCLGFQDVAQGTFFFALEDVYTEGAMAENRAASGGFRLIGADRDHES